ncbi:hypothetical protein QYF61_022673 [Mycteria americana]|uniref:Uncharacterized protein n=1 Tax=Mycteria americana TaxID=33587 RepID=A0AAN7SFS3_MYCAM|nr:hypothetical protein QYF61_022673 [Mycteria americana]
MEDMEGSGSIGLLSESRIPGSRGPKAITANKANPVLEYIRKSIANRYRVVIILALYSGLKDVEKTETVQQRAVQMVWGLEYMTSEERLKELKWFSLAKRRQRHDLIAAYKSLRGNCKYDEAKLFLVEPDGATRDSGHNLQLEMFRLNLRRTCSLGGWCRTGAICPGRLWKLCSWKCSKLCWTEP